MEPIKNRTRCFFRQAEKNKKNGLVVSKFCCPIFSNAKNQFFYFKKEFALIQKNFLISFTHKIKNQYVDKWKNYCALSNLNSADQFCLMSTYLPETVFVEPSPPSRDRGFEGQKKCLIPYDLTGREK